MAQDDDAWRQLKSYLESLRRAGLADLPLGTWDGVIPVAPPASVAAPVSASMPESVRSINQPEPVVATVPDQRFAANQYAEAQAHSPITKNTEVRANTPTGQAAEKRVFASPPPTRTAPATTSEQARLNPFVPAASMFEIARTPFEKTVTAPEDRLPILNALAEEVSACTRCPHLAATRTQTVFASGDVNARLMFIGEAPGAEEDAQGIPFVGKSGRLLSDMITKGMGLDRSQVYVANVLKCRPPDNRPPTKDEMENCFHFLDRQIEIVRPEFICLLGKTAVTAILQTSLPMKNLRRRWYRYKEIPTMVTYHPSYLLRIDAAKKDTWEDLKMLMVEMGISPPPKS